MTWIQQLCSLEDNYYNHNIDQNFGVSDTLTRILGCGDTDNTNIGCAIDIMRVVDWVEHHLIDDNLIWVHWTARSRCHNGDNWKFFASSEQCA